MKEPDTAGDYDEREAQAAYSVLIELGQVLGAYALGEMTLEQVQDDSYRQVRAFLETLGIVT